VSDLNLYVCTGRFGQDPTAKYTPSGAAVCNFSLAISRQQKDKNTGEKKDDTQWVDFVAFGKTAEIISTHMRKGSQCRITGRIQKRKWQDKDGKDRYSTECIVDDFQMLGKKQEQEVAAETAGNDDGPQF
jgi:single-strand DNA-binding protein